MEESIQKELNIIQEEISNIQKALNNIQAKIGDAKTSSKEERPYQKAWDDLMSIKATAKGKWWVW